MKLSKVAITGCVHYCFIKIESYALCGVDVADAKMTEGPITCEKCRMIINAVKSIEASGNTATEP